MRMLTKELPIQQAKEWEVYGDTVVTNSQTFKAELHKYGVTDLFDTKLNIKQDREKYIFGINGINTFAVNSKVDFTTFIKDFYKDIAKTETQKTLISVSEWEKKTKVEITITETAKDLADLENDIKNNNLENNIKKDEILAENATDVENVKYKVGRLIVFYEQEKDLANSETSGWIFNTKYDRKDKGLRKIHKTEIERRLKELNKIKGQIERLANNKDKKYKIDWDIDSKDNTKSVNDIKMDDVNGMDMNITLKQFSDRIEELGKEAPDFILARNDIILEKGNTVPYYEIMIYDKSDARKINKSLKKINNEYAILDKLELTGAKRQELSQDLQDLETYLNKVIDNPDTFKPSEHPFVPKHAQEFYELTKVDPTLKAFMQLNKEAGKTPNETTEAAWAVAGVTQETANKNKKGNEYVGSQYSNAKEAFEKWWINGVSKYRIDQTKMKPEQKQFWWGVGNLAVTGGAIFLGWKMIYSAFKMVFKSDKEKKTWIYDWSNRARLGIPTALIFWANARKGEWLGTLLTWGGMTKAFANMFSWGNTSETANQTAQDKETKMKYAEWFPWATAVFNRLNYGEMKQFLIQDGNQMKIDPNKYDTLLEIFKNWSKRNEAAAKFLESIGRNDEKHVLNLGLTGMGIKREDIENDNNKNKPFDKAASEAIVRLHSVTDFMDKKWYNKINSETQYLVEKYIADGKDSDDLDDLEARGDVFYKETNVVDKTGLAAKIKELANGNKQKEEDLLLAINTFYEKWPTSNKNIEITGNRPKITFKTYNKTATIDLDHKTLDGFTAKNEFSSYNEIFKAANLTNRIKFLCKDKQAVSDKPFYLSTIGRDITFDNAKLFSTDFDTEIMTAWWWGALKKVSPTLEDNKQAYCDYLNTITPKFWKEKINV